MDPLPQLGAPPGTEHRRDRSARRPGTSGLRGQPSRQTYRRGLPSARLARPTSRLRVRDEEFHHFLAPVERAHVVATEGDGGEDDFIHSDRLVLLDDKMRIRGFYDGSDEKEMAKLIEGIRKLRKSIK